MSHDFNYRIDGSDLVPTLVEHCRLVEGIAGQRAEKLEVAYRHGVYVADRHWTQARLMRLETALPFDTATNRYLIQRSGEAVGFNEGCVYEAVNNVFVNHTNIAVGFVTMFAGIV